jgi:hypothetical protein
MNIRLLKEFRILRLPLAATILLTVVPPLIWGSDAIPWMAYAFGAGCLIMAALSFGVEFQNRTLGLLLTAPVSREKIWGEKMLVLGACLACALVAGLLTVWVMIPVADFRQFPWLAVCALPFAAFCTAPLHVLFYRNTLVGILGSAALPVLPLGLVAGIGAWLFPERSVEVPVRITAVLYCLLGVWCGFEKFKTLQILDAHTQEIALPAKLEDFFERPIRRLSAAWTGPFASLVKKELRLQKINFLLAPVFLLIAVVATALHPFKPEVGEGIMLADVLLYVVLIPIISPAVAFAEERTWGMAQWHLSLPPSARRQWAAKLLVILFINLVLGILLPIAVFPLSQKLMGFPYSFGHLEDLANPGFAMIYSLVTVVSFFAASISPNTLRAMISSIGLIILSLALIMGTGRTADDYFRTAGVAYDPMPGLILSLGFILFLLHLSYLNFRVPDLSRLRILLQTGIFITFTTLLTLLALFLAKH